jgi:hypothetical protein
MTAKLFRVIVELGQHYEAIRQTRRIDLNRRVSYVFGRRRLMLAATMLILLCAVVSIVPYVGSARLVTDSPTVVSRPEAVSSIERHSSPPSSDATHAGTSADVANLVSTYKKTPISFEVNRGQVDPRVKFYARGDNYNLFLTAAEAVLSLQVPDASGKAQRPPTDSSNDIFRMRLVGASSKPDIQALDRLPGLVNYFLNKEPSKWGTDVATFAKVRYGHVYPNVDLIYYGTQRQLEYDFIVTPGGNPDHIALTFKGQKTLNIDAEGSLVLHARRGDVHFTKPEAYQEVDGVRQPIRCSYSLKGKHTIGFKVESFDHTKPLIIDPVLSYSTYLGGTQFERGNSIAVDSAGNIYVTGTTDSANFPTMNPKQSAPSGNGDVFIFKLAPNGTNQIYSTYIGGSSEDGGFGVAVDSTANVYVTGFTRSTDFPTVNPAQPTPGGADDAFILKLNAAGDGLVYSTYLGGSGDDVGAKVALDSAGNANIVGSTDSSDLPTKNALQASTGGFEDVMLAKYSPAGAVVYATYLGGNGYDKGYGVAVDGAGNAYVTGATDSTNFPTKNAAVVGYGGSSDAFVTKLNASGTDIVYSTYAGGEGNDASYGIAIDGTGSAYITGMTDSSNLHVIGGGDCFVAKLNPSGNLFTYFTIFGGTEYDGGYGIAVDAAGRAYVTGFTVSSNFPTMQAAQSSFSSSEDAVVARLSSTGQELDFSTYLGGGGDDEGLAIALDSTGNAYVTGFTRSNNFLIVNPIQSNSNDNGDAFVSILANSISPTPTPSPTPTTTPTPTPIPNPIDDSSFFVTQHYRDFLNRQPDASGLQFWINDIEQCGTTQQCRDVHRINVSAAFFLSIEFQETGYLVYRMYKTAYGDSTSPNVAGTVPVVRLEEFLPDTQRIGQGVVVNQGDWQTQLENNKNAFVLEFVQRQRFLNSFPLSLTPAQFVDKLNQNTGGVLTQAQRDQLVAQLSSSADVPAGRASVLRQVAENQALRQNEFNRAFVLMQYFGYLRRNPDDAPDSDFRGWKFWLDKLNQFNGDFQNAEMVKAFISSIEFRNRFGQP